MDKWEKLKEYCQKKIDQAMDICPSFDKSGRNQLRDGCCYMIKHYFDVMLRIEEFQDDEQHG